MKLPRVLRKSSTQRFLFYVAGFLVWLALIKWLPRPGNSYICLLGLGIAFYAYCQWAKDPTGTPPRDFPMFRQASFKFDARTTALIANYEQQRTLLRAAEKSVDDGAELLRTAQKMETDPQELLRSE